MWEIPSRRQRSKEGQASLKGVFPNDLRPLGVPALNGSHLYRGV